jgi:hypothetical protein
MRNLMTLINVKFTAQELELITALASDQLFRREFIDPKMPGFKSNPAEIRIGKDLLARLRSTIAPASEQRTAPVRLAG